MTEPIITSVATKVGVSFAASLAVSQLKKVERTKLGKELAKAGLLTGDLRTQLEKAIVKSTDAFLIAYPVYDIEQVHFFLEDINVCEILAKYLLNGEVPDYRGLAEMLATYVDVPVAKAPDHWPRSIEPIELVKKFYGTVLGDLTMHGDKAMVVLAQKLALIDTGIEKMGASLALIPEKVAQEVSKSRQTDRSTEVAEFEAAYLQHLQRRFSKVSTPGARELHGIGQALSVAYISLNVRSTMAPEPVRAEQFLHENEKIVIRGPAGSGKTTLLSWLVTRCAGAPGGEWSGIIPFFVPLRTVARMEPGAPRVEALVDYSVDAGLWAGEEPAGWTKRILQEHRALIMIDGVDELPGERRPEFWEWLEAVVAEYPGNRVVVTSRTLPKTNDRARGNSPHWNPPHAFVEAQLQEMSDPDIVEFVNHWHDAVDLEKLTPEEQVSLEKAKATLPSKLEDPANRRIRELCSTPLLCAMVCVLHWREEGYLPRQRVDLYDKCCDMLIEARDLKRGILPPPPPLSEMTKNDKEMVLQRLAFEMLYSKPDGDDDDNAAYRIEISREKAIEWIGSKVTSFQQSAARSADPEAVLDFLIERTGLLREPSTGLIDFPHRTFQEYLAACAAGANGQEAFLANQADDDQWHETIMLASGTTTGGVGFGRRLIEALIARGQRHTSLKAKSQRIRKTCFALALGCLENLRQQDPALRDKVLSNLVELVPPRNDGDADILAVAGDATLPHLTYRQWKDEDTSTVSACARSLRLIGTNSAIEALKAGYSEDTRVEVLSQVAKSGEIAYRDIPAIRTHVEYKGSLPSFAQEYGDLELLRGIDGLRILSLEATTKNKPAVAEFTSLKQVTLRNVGPEDPVIHALPASIDSLSIMGWAGSLKWIARFENLRDLALHNVDLSSLLAVPFPPSLRTLRIATSGITSLSGIENLQLSELVIVGCDRLADLTPISSLPLTSLHIEGQDLPFDLSPIGNLKGLHDLTLRTVRPSSSEPLVLPELRVLNLSDASNPDLLNIFAGCTDLKVLEINFCTDLTNLDALSGFRKLTSLSAVLHEPMTLPDLSALSDLEEAEFGNVVGLEHVGLAHLTKLRKLAVFRYRGHMKWLAGITSIEELILEDIGEATTLPTLKEHRKLTSLTLDQFMRLRSLGSLVGTRLRSLTLFACPQLTEIIPLAKVRTLREIALFPVNSLDLSPLVDLPELERISMLRQPVPMRVPEALMPKLDFGGDYRGMGRTYYWGGPRFVGRRRYQLPATLRRRATAPSS